MHTQAAGEVSLHPKKARLSLWCRGGSPAGTRLSQAGAGQSALQTAQLPAAPCDPPEPLRGVAPPGAPDRGVRRPPADPGAAAGALA